MNNVKEDDKKKPTARSRLQTHKIPLHFIKTVHNTCNKTVEIKKI